MSTRIEIDGRSFALPDDHSLPPIMAEIEAAASSSPAFVTLSAEGRSVSVLIRSTTRVVISVERDGHVEPDQGVWELPFDEWEL